MTVKIAQIKSETYFFRCLHHKIKS